MSKKVVVCNDSSGKLLGWMIRCPGCGSGHLFEVGLWTFNGNEETPTFSPSLRIEQNPVSSVCYDPGIPTSVCHFDVKGGKILFAADSTHALAGQQVDLPDVPEQSKTG